MGPRTVSRSLFLAMSLALLLGIALVCHWHLRPRLASEFGEFTAQKSVTVLHEDKIARPVHDATELCLEGVSAVLEECDIDPEIRQAFLAELQLVGKVTVNSEGETSVLRIRLPSMVWRERSWKLRFGTRMSPSRGDAAWLNKTIQDEVYRTLKESLGIVRP